MQRVGKTPLVHVEGIYVKLECTNPCGSIKDRISVYILDESVRLGLLRPGQRIVEATSGNTGIALAWYAREKGYPITIVMPENMTEERKQALRKLGAELILSSEEGSFAEAARVRDRLAAEHGWFNPDQFSNPLNAECHDKTTGEEIATELAARGVARIDAFVAGVGTGGTLIGVGRRLRRSFPELCLVAVEPAESAVLSGGPPGPHAISGLGDGFIPALAGDGHGGRHPSITEVACVSTADAERTARRLAEEHGFCVGVSSGANFLAAQALRARFETVVTAFPDGYAKYQSVGLRHCEPGRCAFEHDSLVSPGSLLAPA
ncbi:MAG: cysteine synthase family protein [Myxococcales bacterium]|nr:cysteine synthase family protein [Myxococcales bacterium]